jgi:hypothetical protein
VTQERPNTPELVSLNEAVSPGYARAPTPSPSTLNPKVEGSNPSRPMRFAGKVLTREADAVAARVTRTVQRDFAESPPARASDHDPISWFAALSSPGEAEIAPAAIRSASPKGGDRGTIPFCER